jgi:hypothetical protein
VSMNDHSVIKRKKLKKEKYVEKLQFQIIGARQYIIRSVMILCDKMSCRIKIVWRRRYHNVDEDWYIHIKSAM